MELNELLETVNAEMDYYEIIFIENGDVIGEEGHYRHGNGYGLRNKVSGVIEHTTIMLPGAIYQGQHLDATMKSLVAGRDPVADQLGGLAAMSTEDVTPN